MASNESKPREQAPKVSTPEKSVRSGTPVPKDEGELTDHEIVQRRTPDIDGQDPWPADGRFHRVFTVAIARTSTGTGATSDWDAPEYDEMHEANKIAVLQEAMNVGLHPREEAVFDGAGPVNEAAGVCALTYSVKVVPASSEAPEDTAPLTLTPSQAIENRDGTTLRDGEPLTSQVGTSREPK